MKLIIFGISCIGKSIIADRLAKYYNLDIIHTDDVRRELKYHQPHLGFDTEINPLSQNIFCRYLRNLRKNRVIIEGNALNPTNIKLNFQDYNSFMLYRDVSPEKLLSISRKYDADDKWTRFRDDKYLLKLFSFYIKSQAKWLNQFKGNKINTMDMNYAFNRIISIIESQSNYVNFNCIGG